jgi:hypothetical protein
MAVKARRAREGNDPPLRPRRAAQAQPVLATVLVDATGVRGLLVQKTGLSARELAEVGCLQGSILAAADEFGEDLRGRIAREDPDLANKGSLVI